MFKNKIKAYKFSITMSIVCLLLTGINYIFSRVRLSGIAFIIVSIATVVVIICYFIEFKRNCKRMNI